jgi:hypothetical protein
LILENSWLETPVEYIDYWQISVSFSETPKDIKSEPNEGGGQTLHFPVSNIILKRPASPIVKISVHEAVWSDAANKESIAYDHAIVFYRKDGKRFSFLAHESIADLLDCTEDANEIEAIIERHRCRLEIT